MPGIEQPRQIAASDLVGTLETIDARLRWLAAWTIHNATTCVTAATD